MFHVYVWSLHSIVVIYLLDTEIRNCVVQSLLVFVHRTYYPRLTCLFSVPNLSQAEQGRLYLLIWPCWYLLGLSYWIVVRRLRISYNPGLVYSPSRFSCVCWDSFIRCVQAWFHSELNLCPVVVHLKFALESLFW